VRIASDVRCRPRQPTDVEEAYACGRWAVELAVAGTSGVMVSIIREANEPYRWSLGTAPLSDVALGAKPMPDEYISAEGITYGGLPGVFGATGGPATRVCSPSGSKVTRYI